MAAMNEGPKIEAKGRQRQRSGVLGGGSKLSTAEPRPPNGLRLFSALRMASPDTIVLLIVDYHAAIGGRTPVPLA